VVKNAPSIGDLRQRVMVARRNRAPDLDFGFVETMTLLGEAWARIEQTRDGVGYLDDATDAAGPEVTHEFTLRRDPLVNLPDARTYVIHGGRRYKVLRVREDDQTGRHICLLCAMQESGPDGPDLPGWVLNAPDGTPLVSSP
jgi:head-tail adaptor